MTGVSFLLHRSNALEVLVDRLAQLVAEPVGPPSQSELIVVQSRGMERWVSQQLARRLGIWANGRFLFPRNLVEHILAEVLDEEREVAHPYSPESLTWAVAALLPELSEEPAFAPLRSYLQGDEGGVRRLQLARRVGDLFDQYVVYRPELVAAWESGKDDDWQARLWRALVQRGRGRHLADRAGECLSRLAVPDADLGALPRRVTLFGISTLPPLFVRVLGGLSTHLDVHLLQLSPCQEFWADLRRSDARPEPAGPEVNDALATEANPLLASLGKLGRDFQSVLENDVTYEDAEGELYRDPRERIEAPTALHILQSDLLHQRRRTITSEEHPPLPLADGDESISVHSCHGPMREAEVLRDQLLALFETDPTLEPRDVLVMTPDIDTYAPYIDAALGATAEIPYSIADRSVRRSLPLVEGFLAVLDVLSSRFTATSVMDLLGHGAVRDRFGLSDQDVDAARRWITEAAIRWGVDGRHREELGLPPYDENTWRFGLDRLLLAHALPADGRTLFAETLPCGSAARDAAAGLGGLAELCETLFELRARLATDRTVEDWREVLVEVLDRTVSAEWSPLQHQLVREGLDQLAESARVAAFDDTVALDAIRDEVGGGFDATVGSAGFLTGGVTVCELLPMRSIPFRVVALLGMNDDAFPRKQRRLGFDRLAEKPRAGDRNTRDDDRYQLLECLLAARERLIVTYVGQSSRDNSALPPSVVVSELLDTVADSCARDGMDVADHRESLVLRHPLQPFSPRYFDPREDARLFSFDSAQAQGAARLGEPRVEPARFVTELSSPEPESELALDALLRFFDNPARALLAGPLGLTLGGDVSALQDREPMVLDGLSRWKLGSCLLDEALQHGDPARLYAATRADGALPLGGPGRLAFEALIPGVEALRGALDPWVSQPQLAALRVEIPLEHTRLTGWIRGLSAEVQLRYRYGQLRARDLLAAWTTHLALCAMGSAAGATMPDTTVMVGRAPRKVGQVEVKQLVASADARATLAELVRLYEAGQQIPLRLFAEPSLAYVSVLRGAEEVDDATRAAALDAARRAFMSSRYNRGDDADVYVCQAHAGVDDVLSGEPAGLEGRGLGFAAVSETVFGPLLDHLEGL